MKVYNMIDKIKQMFLKLFKPKSVAAPLEPVVEYVEPIVEYVEPEFLHNYNEYTYKTELQIVFRDNQVLCSDYSVTMNTMYYDEEYLKTNGNRFINEHIHDAYKNTHLGTFDKSNKHYTVIPTSEIKKILYKEPIISVEYKQIRNPKYVNKN